jgi:sugar lactone lactonase YvrE
MSTHVSVDVAVPAAAVLGEGPVWDATGRRLLWLDIEGRNLHWYDPVSRVDRSVATTNRVGAAALRRGGGLVMAMEHAFALTAAGDDDPVVIATVEPSAPTRMNDGNCDSRGRFYAGTMALDESSPVGGLYRLDPDGAVEQILSNVTVSNGIDWSLDGETMFYVDSAAQSLDAFDFDVTAGRISNRRTVVRFSLDEGTPDGLTIDREGHVWVALWGGWSIRRYTTAGELDRTVTLPAQNITSAAFGGELLDELYVTSAREGLTDSELDDQPDAGALFRCRPGVVGRRQHMYAG